MGVSEGEGWGRGREGDVRARAAARGDGEGGGGARTGFSAASPLCKRPRKTIRGATPHLRLQAERIFIWARLPPPPATLALVPALPLPTAAILAPLPSPSAHRNLKSA